MSVGPSGTPIDKDVDNSRDIVLHYESRKREIKTRPIYMSVGTMKNWRWEIYTSVIDSGRWFYHSNSPVKILDSRYACKKNRAKSSKTWPEVLTSIDRNTMGSGLSVYIWRKCRIFILSVLLRTPSGWGTPIIFSVWQDDLILDLDVTPFIVSSRSYSMGFNSVPNRV
jgi:hypothetical protein